MPIRVALTAPAADVVSAVVIALSTGAGVITLARPVDLTDPAVAGAMDNALRHDVVVVTEAPAVPPGEGAPSSTTTNAPAPDGVLRVGGIRQDASLIESYLSGTVDVLAPGDKVLSLARGGAGQVECSGTDYAVAFVAGQVALVRAAHPDLTAAQVVHRIKVTADAITNPVPDPAYGWGVINVNSAVSASLEDLAHPLASRIGPKSKPRRSVNPTPGPVILIVVMLGLLTTALVVIRVRLVARARTTSARDGVLIGTVLDR